MTIDVHVATAGVSQLIGCGIKRYQRICDMVCLYFANPRCNVSYATRIGCDEPYGLHMPCWVRVLWNGKIIAASEEMFVPADEKNEDFHYDVDRSVFDDAMDRFIALCNDCTVRAVKLQTYGDLTISLNNGFEIEAMVNRANPEDEAWRFMADECSPHIIASAGEYVYSDPD